MLRRVAAASGYLAIACEHFETKGGDGGTLVGRSGVADTRPTAAQGSVSPLIRQITTTPCGASYIRRISTSRRLLMTLPLLGSLLLAGCGHTAAQPGMTNVTTATMAPPTLSSMLTTPPSEAAEKSSRGLIHMKVHQPIDFTDQSGAITATLVLEKLTVDGNCTSQYAQKPEHGHFLIVKMRVETTSNLSPNEYLSIIPAGWSIVGSDGIIESSVSTGPSFSCLDPKDHFPNEQFAPAAKYRGAIVLDTANTSGILMYRPLGKGGGWEWTFPQ